MSLARAADNKNDEMLRDGETEWSESSGLVYETRDVLLRVSELQAQVLSHVGRKSSEAGGASKVPRG